MKTATPKTKTFMFVTTTALVLSSTAVSAMFCGNFMSQRSMSYGPPPMGPVGYGMPSAYMQPRGMMLHRNSYMAAPAQAQVYYPEAPSVYAPEPRQLAAASTSTNPGSVDSGAVVSINQMSFQPATIRIKPGGEVTWQSNSPMPHTVKGRSEGGPDSQAFNRGQAFSHQFDAPGSYEYFCSIHPGMTGTIIVE